MVRLECRGVPSHKIAVCLEKFGKRFPFRYHIQMEGVKTIAEFQVISMSSLNELRRRLGHIKNVDFEFSKIEKVLEDE